MSQPISAPPVPSEQELQDYDDAVQFEPQAPDQTVGEEDFGEYVARAAEHREAVRAAASVPRYQEVMRISDKTNYRHYYEMPASVGIQNIPRLVDEMIREGSNLRNIAIDFEYRETRR